jgi:DNA-binding winged helix-turn-helix (wHTH) protein
MVWHFAQAELDEAQMELRVQGQVASLERKPLEVLRYLLRHANEVVTKDELQAAVWPGRVLSDTVLTKAVGRIREELGAGADGLIKTVHGYGYRLLGQVRVVAPKAVSLPAPHLKLKAGDSPFQRSHWVLERHLARGGSGELWLVRHCKSGENRAFKFALDASGLQGLKREITVHRLLSSQLAERSPSLPVLDFNLEEVPFFLELPYISHGNLADWAAQQWADSAFALPQRLRLMVDIAEAVALAHGVGVLHKDLKPANVLIEPTSAGPRPLLADFGSAGVLSDQILEAAGITRVAFTQTPSALGGSTLYLAPELLRGQPFTMQADLYALGVMLYQLVAGDFQRPVATGWERDIADPLLREDIALAIHGDPAARSGSVAEWAAHLRQIEHRRADLAQKQKDSDARAAADEKAKRALAEAERLRLKRTWMWATAVVFFWGAIIATGFALRAERAAKLAQTALASSQASTRFLVDDVLGAVSLRHGPTKQLSLNQIVERAARRVDARFPKTDLASRAQAYRALYEVYGISDYASMDPGFDQWLHEAMLQSLIAWFADEPEVAFPLAYEVVVGADFWIEDARLKQLLHAVRQFAATNTHIPDTQRLTLAVFSNEDQVKTGQWLAAAAGLRALLPQLQAALPTLLLEDSYSAIAALNNATRLGLHVEGKQLCIALLEQVKQGAHAANTALRLDVYEACVVAAVYRADAAFAAQLARAGLVLARANFDELVGYVPTFSRFLASAEAQLGNLDAALHLVDQAIAIRRARADGLLPYALVGRGQLREQAGMAEGALADYQEASQSLRATTMPMLAIEAHSRYARALVAASQRLAAQQALAQIPAAAIAQLPVQHRSRAALLQAQAALAAPAAAHALLAAADAQLAAIGYPESHFWRLQIRTDGRRLAAG